jgi:putative transposase
LGFAPALPPSAEELSILLGRTDTRALQHYGIKFASLRYNCDDLLTLRTRVKGQTVKIKYHPADLSCLYVYDPFERQYIRVPALDQEYTQGLSLWKHRVIRQAVLDEQEQVDLVALGQAKRKIQAIVEEGRQRKRQQTRTRIARWDTAGKPTRQVATGTSASEIEADPPPAVTEARPKTITAADQAAVSIETLDDAEWEVSYVPLKQLAAPVLDAPRTTGAGQGVKAKAEEVRHG